MEVFEIGLWTLAIAFVLLLATSSYFYWQSKLNEVKDEFEQKMTDLAFQQKSMEQDLGNLALLTEEKEAQLSQLIAAHNDTQVQLTKLTAKPVPTRTHVTETNSSRLSKEDEAWLAQVEAFVRNGISNSYLNVDFLADEFSLSSRHFTRKMNQLTNTSPGKYIHEIRLLVAKEILLEQPGISVKELSFKVGFRTPEYFSRVFKDKFGELPSTYLT